MAETWLDDLDWLLLFVVLAVVLVEVRRRGSFHSGSWLISTRR